MTDRLFRFRVSDTQLKGTCQILEIFHSFRMCQSAYLCFVIRFPLFHYVIHNHSWCSHLVRSTIMSSYSYLNSSNSIEWRHKRMNPKISSSLNFLGAALAQIEHCSVLLLLATPIIWCFLMYCGPRSIHYVYTWKTLHKRSLVIATNSNFNWHFLTFNHLSLLLIELHQFESKKLIQTN